MMRCRNSQRAPSNQKNHAKPTRPKNHEKLTPLNKAAPTVLVAEPTAGVRHGVKAFAFRTTETPPNRAGESARNTTALASCWLKKKRNRGFSMCRRFMCGGDDRHDRIAAGLSEGSHHIRLRPCCGMLGD